MYCTGATTTAMASSSALMTQTSAAAATAPKVGADGVGGKEGPPVSAEQRMQYLLAQSDVFAHFLAGELS